jgi:hypothetical protein
LIVLALLEAAAATRAGGRTLLGRRRTPAFLDAEFLSLRALLVLTAEADAHEEQDEERH